MEIFTKKEKDHMIYFKTLISCPTEDSVFSRFLLDRSLTPKQVIEQVKDYGRFFNADFVRNSNFFKIEHDGDIFVGFINMEYRTGFIVDRNDLEEVNSDDIDVGIVVNNAFDDMVDIIRKRPSDVIVDAKTIGMLKDVLYRCLTTPKKINLINEVKEKVLEVMMSAIITPPYAPTDWSDDRGFVYSQAMSFVRDAIFSGEKLDFRKGDINIRVIEAKYEDDEK